MLFTIDIGGGLYKVRSDGRGLSIGSTDKIPTPPTILERSFSQD